jgi:hypothetical protein
MKGRRNKPAGRRTRRGDPRYDESTSLAHTFSDRTSCKEIERIIGALGNGGRVSVLDKKLLEMHCLECRKCKDKNETAPKS